MFYNESNIDAETWAQMSHMSLIEGVGIFIAVHSAIEHILFIIVVIHMIAYSRASLQKTADSFMNNQLFCVCASLRK